MNGEWIYGFHGVLGALSSSGTRVVKILYSRDPRDPEMTRILAAASEKGIDVEKVSAELITRKTESKKHRGVAAFCMERGYMALDELLAGITRENGLVVVLDGIEDPQNLGALLRTCECAGVDGIILPQRRSAAISAAVVNASAGASEFLKIVRVANLQSALEKLKDKGYWIVVAEAGGETRYTEFDYRVPVVLVLGSEGKGVRRLIQETCDQILSIPTFGKTGCLNVSVAGGVILYEIVRQRNLGLVLKEKGEENRHVGVRDSR